MTYSRNYFFRHIEPKGKERRKKITIRQDDCFYLAGWKNRWLTIGMFLREGHC